MFSKVGQGLCESIQPTLGSCLQDGFIEHCIAMLFLALLTQAKRSQAHLLIVPGYNGNMASTWLMW